MENVNIVDCQILLVLINILPTLKINIDKTKYFVIFVMLQITRPVRTCFIWSIKICVLTFELLMSSSY